MRRLSCLILTIFVLLSLAACTPYDPTQGLKTESSIPSSGATVPTTAVPTQPASSTATVPSDGPHVHSYFGDFVDATCTQQGYMLHICACGDSFADSYTDALGHAWGQWYTAKAPTEAEEGLRQRDCDRCAESEPQVLEKLEPAHLHSYTSNVVEPTCTENGYTRHTCACGDSYTSVSTSPLGHSFTESKSNGNATCTSDGTKTAKCDRCDATYTVADPGSVLGHSWGLWVTVKEATAAEEGLQRRTCGSCGGEEERAIDKLTDVHIHAYSATLIAPNCTEAGYTLHSCSCGEIYQDGFVSALGHSFTHYQSNHDGDCTSDGTKTAHCDRCDATSTVADAGSVLGHSWGNWVMIQEPTVSQEGLQERRCGRCNASEQRPIDKLTQEHTHSYWKNTVAPTCTEDGYTEYSCACGDQYTDDFVAALGHSFTHYVSNGDATCTSDGTKTARCDRCTVTSTVADASSVLGHSWGDWVITREPTANLEGIKTRTCARCGAEDNQYIEKHKHSYSSTQIAPTCEEEGYTLYQCACGDSYRDNITEPLGHDWPDWVITKEPTSQEEGMKARTCRRCGAEETQTVDKLPQDHEHTYKKQKVAATCIEGGYTLYTCECGHSYREDTSEPKGHSWGQWQVTTAPTTDSVGERTRICEACGESESGSVDMLLEAGDFVLVFWTETVNRNEDACVMIYGVAGVEYDIDVYYSSGESTAQGLENQVADENGCVTWVWHVGGRTKAGTYKIEISGGGITKTIYFTVVVE